MHILVTSERQGTALRFPGLLAGTEALEDHDAVGHRRSDKGSAVAEDGPAAGRIEGDVAQAVAEGGEEEGHVPDEPAELEAVGGGLSVGVWSGAVEVTYVCASFINLAPRGSLGEACVGAIVAAVDRKSSVL